MRRSSLLLGLCFSVIFFSSFTTVDPTSYYHLLKNNEESTVKLKRPSFALKQKRGVTLYAEYVTRLVQPEKEGLLRGVQIGMTPQQVKEAESASLILDKDDALTYTVIFRYDEQGIELADITYLFDESNKLHSIEVSYHFASESLSQKVYDRFVTYFSEKYGSSYDVTVEGEATWDVPLKKNHAQLQMHHQVINDQPELVMGIYSGAPKQLRSAK